MFYPKPLCAALLSQGGSFELFDEGIQVSKEGGRVAFGSILSKIFGQLHPGLLHLRDFLFQRSQILHCRFVKFLKEEQKQS